jgi:hypothetical protein
VLTVREIAEGRRRRRCWRPKKKICVLSLMAFDGWLLCAEVLKFLQDGEINEFFFFFTKLFRSTVPLPEQVSI